MTERLRRPLAIRSGSSPFEIALLTSSVLSSAAGVIAPATRAQALAVSFSPVFLLVFNLLIALWALLALSGVLPDLRDQAQHRLAPTLERAADLLHARLRREQIGLVGFSGTALGLGIAVLAYAGAHGLTTASQAALFGLVALWRCAQIRTDLHKLEETVTSPSLANPPALGDPGNGR